MTPNTVRTESNTATTRKGIHNHLGNANHLGTGVPPTIGLPCGGLCPPEPSRRSLAVFLGGFGGPPLHLGCVFGCCGFVESLMHVFRSNAAAQGARRLRRTNANRHAIGVSNGAAWLGFVLFTRLSNYQVFQGDSTPTSGKRLLRLVPCETPSGPLRPRCRGRKQKVCGCGR